jgi:hypothetical protein
MANLDQPMRNHRMREDGQEFAIGECDLAGSLQRAVQCDRAQADTFHIGFKRRPGDRRPRWHAQHVAISAPAGSLARAILAILSATGDPPGKPPSGKIAGKIVRTIRPHRKSV